MSKLTKRGRELRRINLFVLGFVLAFAGAGPLASCSSMSGSTVGGELPTALGGLPADAPARAETQPDYPAVHDMPPARKSKVMTEEEKKRVEAELTVARDKQAKRAQQSAKKPEEQ
jgi:hypothetical protein